MDNARWIVVLSVVISMMATLTILNRYAARPRHETAVAGAESVAAVPQRAVEANKPAINRPSRREVPRFSKISFPKPAAHTTVVDQPRDFEKLNESIKVEGNIIK